MKNATEFGKKFKKFRDKLTAREVTKAPNGVIGEVIYAHLLWNANEKQADIAFKKLLSASVDLNDLRMNHVYETVDLIGSSYPQAQERAKRMKSVLNSIYRREHGVHIDSLEGSGKRDIREYFETLDGITPFVCNRVISVFYDVSAVPVDDRTLAILIENNLVHESSKLADTASWLGRQVKSDDVVLLHGSLQAWVEKQPTPKPKKQATKKVKKKKVAKKKVAKNPIAEKKVIKKKVEKKKVEKKKVAKKKVAKKKVAKKKVAKKKVAKKKVAKKKVAKKKVAKKKVAKKRTSKKKALNK